MHAAVSAAVVKPQKYYYVPEDCLHYVQQREISDARFGWYFSPFVGRNAASTGRLRGTNMRQRPGGNAGDISNFRLKSDRRPNDHNHSGWPQFGRPWQLSVSKWRRLLVDPRRHRNEGGDKSKSAPLGI